MVRTSYGMVGKDVGVSNDKCGIKVVSFQQIVETNNITIPHFQRDIQEDKVQQIVQKYIEDHKTRQNYFIKHGYTICLCKIGKRLYLIDGQHRYQALKIVYASGYKDNVLIRIQICETIDEMKQDFALLNINSNIPIVYTYFEDEFVQELMLSLKTQLKNQFSSCFSRSQSKTCNRMHIDEFMGLFDLEHIKQLYLENNKINLLEQLEIINEVVKMLLYENDQSVQKYVTKTDLPIVQEYGFYLSLKNINWINHFLCTKESIHIDLLANTKKYKKQKIPKTLREVVIHNHFGESFIATCFVCNLELNRNNAQIGHIEPEVEGGAMVESNLRCICKCCNSSMGTQNMLIFKSTYFS